MLNIFHTADTPVVKPNNFFSIYLIPRFCKLKYCCQQHARVKTCAVCLNKTASGIGLRLRLWRLKWRLGRERPRLPLTFISQLTSNYSVFVELKIRS